MTYHTFSCQDWFERKSDLTGHRMTYIFLMSMVDAKKCTNSLLAAKCCNCTIPTWYEKRKKARELLAIPSSRPLPDGALIWCSIEGRAAARLAPAHILTNACASPCKLCKPCVRQPMSETYLSGTLVLDVPWQMRLDMAD